MKICPKCGKRFNIWQRAIGEHKEHVQYCCHSGAMSDKHTLAATCRGCPAGCFEGLYDGHGKGPVKMTAEKGGFIVRI